MRANNEKLNRLRLRYPAAFAMFRPGLVVISR